MKKILLTALAALTAISASATEVGFSSQGTAKPLVLKTIAAAKKHIAVAAYFFTDKDIANALVAAKNRGVAVGAVFDKNDASRNIACQLRQSGVPVRRSADRSLQHSKFIVVDFQYVQTGSYNYTWKAADSNYENVIVVNDKGVAAQYITEFKTVWQHAGQWDCQ